MSQLEEKSALATARDKGTKEGIKIGIEEGKKQGIEEGQKQEKEKIAKELFKQGIEISKISKITGITIGELLKLKNEK